MKKYITILAALLVSGLSALAQPSAQDFLDRYNIVLKNLGPTGVGLETLLDRWEALYPEDENMMLGKFSYYYNKSQTSEVVKKDAARYLGNAPFLALKDSLNNPVNYFQVVNFDDSLFGIASTQINKLISKEPTRLDYRFLKVSSLISYEKDSPDMALSELRGLIDYNYHNTSKWVYPNEEVDNDFFKSAIQEFCFAMFKMGTPACYKAFKELSQLMLTYNPNDILFMDDMGSYYLVAEHNSKLALKYYNKVLKAKPDDITAIQNCILLARNDKNVKLEKKFLPMLIKYSTDDATKESAQVRLQSLNSK
jgi:hypothetical protein